MDTIYKTFTKRTKYFVASVSKWTFSNDKINAFLAEHWNAVYKWPILEMQYEKINTQSMKTYVAYYSNTHAHSNSRHAFHLDAHTHTRIVQVKQCKANHM